MNAALQNVNRRCYLAFPPGWSLCCGGPHVALPAIAAFLRANRIQVRTRDLNLEWARRRGAIIDANDCKTADRTGTLEAMNETYFAKEDPLQELAAEFCGEWNLQTGFHYKSSEVYRLEVALSCARSRTPFTDFLATDGVDDVLDFDPEVVGISVAAWQQLIPALEFAFRLRQAGFDKCIALGGNTISRLADELPRKELFQLVDVLGTFAGESSMLDIVERSSTKRFDGINGVIWHDDGEVRRSRNARSRAVNTMPRPDFTGLPIGSYPGVNYLPIFINRGCYYGKCSFCAIPYGWGDNAYDGARTAETVADDIEQLVEGWRVRRFKFIDEAVHPSQMARFARRVLERGLGIEWEVYARLEHDWCNEQFVQLVARAGLRKAYFGLELLPTLRRTSLGKRDQPNPDTLLRICNDHGIRVHFFCMFGYPGTTRSDAVATTEYVLRNSRQLDSADLFPWTLAKHTVVSGVRIANATEEVLRVEFDHVGEDGNLSSTEIAALAAEMEELVWDAAPRLLHPIHRMVAPWDNEYPTVASNALALHGSDYV